METVFQQGALTRTAAVAVLTGLGLSKTAAYNALSPDGRFVISLRACRRHNCLEKLIQTFCDCASVQILFAAGAQFGTNQAREFRRDAVRESP